MRLDHVLMAVQDLDRAAARLHDAHGLVSVDGGAHPGWGTANRLVPLGDSYLELIAVVDAGSEHPIAKAVGGATSQGDTLLGVCCETSDVEAVAQRLGTGVLPGSRSYADGTEVTWRLTGVEASLTDLRPFFIEWDAHRELRMGQARTRHDVELTGAIDVEVGGDVEVLQAWLGAPVPGVHLVGGADGARRLSIGTIDGPIVLEAARGE